MAYQALDKLLTQLEASRIRFGRAEAAAAAKLLTRIARLQIRNTTQLIRLHEALLFLRAFPQGPRVRAQVEKMLREIAASVEQLKARGADLTDLDTFEAAGIPGTTLQDVLSFDVARWLTRRLPNQVEIAWEDHEDERALGSILPLLLPLLDDDTDVEADTPFRRWLQAARSGPELPWLLRRFESLPFPRPMQSRLYEALKLPIRWTIPNNRFSRTLNWQQTMPVYYHRHLIARREVSLQQELAASGPKLHRVSPHQSENIVNQIREVMAVRYRELYGTTLADPRSVVKTDVGRGVVLYFWNLPPDRRLSLRGYTAGFTLKNGVPINYIEAIGLCEWIEIGFNTFYTFRDGETAWIYAQVLRCLHALMGAKCFSVYPYQIGKDNDEAIESGAFWFYRKLGFRPGRDDLLELTRREEYRIASDSHYRTPARTLRRLADAHMFFEMSGCEQGAWDNFSARNLGLKVSDTMRRKYDGDPRKLREAASKFVSHALAVDIDKWEPLQKKAFTDWATVLHLVPDLRSWTAVEKSLLADTIRAKPARNEMSFMRLSQRHPRLRRALLRLGSRHPQQSVKR
jgi:hypothetical protein